MSTKSHLGEELSAAVKQVTDLGRTTGEKMDEARHGTAGATVPIGSAPGVGSTDDSSRGSRQD